MILLIQNYNISLIQMKILKNSLLSKMKQHKSERSYIRFRSHIKRSFYGGCLQN